MAKSPNKPAGEEKPKLKSKDREKCLGHYESAKDLSERLNAVFESDIKRKRMSPLPLPGTSRPTPAEGPRSNVSPLDETGRLLNENGPGALASFDKIRGEFDSLVQEHHALWEKIDAAGNDGEKRNAEKKNGDFWKLKGQKAYRSIRLKLLEFFDGLLRANYWDNEKNFIQACINCVSEAINDTGDFPGRTPMELFSELDEPIEQLYTAMNVAITAAGQKAKDHKRLEEATAAAETATTEPVPPLPFNPEPAGEPENNEEEDSYEVIFGELKPVLKYIIINKVFWNNPQFQRDKVDVSKAASTLLARINEIHFVDGIPIASDAQKDLIRTDLAKLVDDMDLQLSTHPKSVIERISDWEIPILRWKFGKTLKGTGTGLAAAALVGTTLLVNKWMATPHGTPPPNSNPPPAGANNLPGGSPSTDAVLPPVQLGNLPSSSGSVEIQDSTNNIKATVAYASATKTLTFCWPTERDGSTLRFWVSAPNQNPIPIIPNPGPNGTFSWRVPSELQNQAAIGISISVKDGAGWGSAGSYGQISTLNN